MHSLTRAVRLLAIAVWALTATSPGVAQDVEGVEIEYIAHACFRLHSPEGSTVLIDPFASRVWLGYDLPADLTADAVLVTHPHYDHDGGEWIGRTPPWPEDSVVYREPGEYTVGDIVVRGVRGKHADPWGHEFGQLNTIWRIEVGGVVIVHLGDNGPLTEEIVKELGRVDVLMTPLDGHDHILKRSEVRAIRDVLKPSIVIPMHYRHPELEQPGSPKDLGDLEPALKGEPRVDRLQSNRLRLTRDGLPREEEILVLRHSPLVSPTKPAPVIPKPTEAEGLVWIEGLVVLPEGLPEGEQVQVVSKGRRLENGERPRAAVGSDGRFKIGVASGSRRVRLGVKSDHLFTSQWLTVKLKRPPASVELHPQLGVKFVVELLTDQEDTSLWESASVALNARVRDEHSSTRIYSVTATPDSDLRAIFPGFPAAESYFLSVTPKNGIPVKRGEIRVRVGETKVWRVAVSNGAHLSGRVLDQSGQPIPGAEILLRIQSRPGGVTRYQRTDTECDANGRFEITAIPPGDLGLDVAAEGFVGKRVNLGAAEVGDILRREPIVLSSGHRVVVEVVWPDGTPVQEGQVALDGPGEWTFRFGRKPTLGLRALSGGEVEFSGLKSGPFIVSAVSLRVEEREGVDRERRYFARLEEVRPGTTARLVLEAGALIEGQVVDQNGMPITQYKLHAEPADVDVLLGSFDEQVTNEEGHFVLDLQPGRWKLSIRGDGYGSQVIQVPDPSHPYVVVTRATTVMGFVVDAAGKPVPHASLMAEHRSGGPTGRSVRTSVGCRAAADGSWSMAVPAGVVWIQARTRGLRSIERVRLEGEPGQVVGPIELVIE